MLDVMLSGGTAGLVEAVKQFLKPYALLKDWDETVYVKWVTLIALVASWFMAAVSFMADPEGSLAGHIVGAGVSPLVGVFAAGVVIFFGNQVFHQLYDSLRGVADILQTYSDKLEDSRPPVPNQTRVIETK